MPAEMPAQVVSLAPQTSRFAEPESLRSFYDPKEAGPFCGSFLRKGEVFAYVGLIQNLKDLKGLMVLH